MKYGTHMKFAKLSPLFKKNTKNFNKQLNWEPGKKKLWSLIIINKMRDNGVRKNNTRILSD